MCHETFSQRAGTIFFRRRTTEATITHVVTLVSHGCPIPAIQVAFDLQAQTVRDWVDAAGAHAEAVDHAEVVCARDLVQVQADAIHVKTQAGVLWMAMAMMVSTRLWLGGAIRAHRDRDLIGRLVASVAACATWGPLLFVSDGLVTYIDAVRKAFRTRQPGTGGRPRLIVNSRTRTYHHRRPQCATHGRPSCTTLVIVGQAVPSGDSTSRDASSPPVPTTRRQSAPASPPSVPLLPSLPALLAHP